jgi:hypothetical protein
LRLQGEADFGGGGDRCAHVPVYIYWLISGKYQELPAR